jgi:hypothetical protein
MAPRIYTTLGFHSSPSAALHTEPVSLPMTDTPRLLSPSRQRHRARLPLHTETNTVPPPQLTAPPLSLPHRVVQWAWGPGPGSQHGRELFSATLVTCHRSGLGTEQNRTEQTSNTSCRLPLLHHGVTEVLPKPPLVGAAACRCRAARLIGASMTTDKVTPATRHAAVVVWYTSPAACPREPY